MASSKERSTMRLERRSDFRGWVGRTVAELDWTLAWFWLLIVNIRLEGLMERMRGWESETKVGRIDGEEERMKEWIRCNSERRERKMNKKIINRCAILVHTMPKLSQYCSVLQNFNTFETPLAFDTPDGSALITYKLY